MASEDPLSSLPAGLHAQIAVNSSADAVPFRARTAYIHRTWARTFSSLPELYIQPHTVTEVEKAVTLARQCRRRIVVVTSPCDNSLSPSLYHTCTRSLSLFNITARY